MPSSKRSILAVHSLDILGVDLPPSKKRSLVAASPQFKLIRSTCPEVYQYTYFGRLLFSEEYKSCLAQVTSRLAKFIMEDILTTINLETYCKVGNIRRGVICDLLMERKFKTLRNIAKLYYAYCQHQLTVCINCLTANS